MDSEQIKNRLHELISRATVTSDPQQLESILAELRDALKDYGEQKKREDAVQDVSGNAQQAQAGS
jgi:acetylornithine deacetylase/succinyl-diaminopimelate desuccinylase-like protein